MAASAALALGTVLVYEAFFISLDTFNYYTDYLNVASWADNRIWQAQDKLRQGVPLAGQEGGEFTENNKIFRWSLACGPLDEQARLYALDLSLSWKTGKRNLALSRSTYEILREK